MVVETKKTSSMEIDFGDGLSRMKDTILSKLNDTDIYSYYLGTDIKLGKSIKSPLRMDNNPSFSFFLDTSLRIKWKDFATGEMGDCFDFVRKLLNVDFFTAVNIIYKDLVKPQIKNLDNAYAYGPRKRVIAHSSSTSDDNKPASISVEERFWNSADINYWKDNLVSLAGLFALDVKPYRNVWFGSKIAPMVSAPSNPIYGIEFEDMIGKRYKIYRPLSLDRHTKHYHNCLSADIIGYKQLPKEGNVLIITKSLKDVLVLRELQLNAISPISESTMIPNIFIDALKKRFKNIFILYDNDKAGITHSAKLRDKYDLRSFFFDPRDAKDACEYGKAYGKDILLEYIVSSIRKFMGNDTSVNDIIDLTR